MRPWGGIGRLRLSVYEKLASDYVHRRMAPAEPIRSDFVPLAERLKAYARRDAIEAGDNKVVMKH
jgi:hypothetical protein